MSHPDEARPTRADACSLPDDRLAERVAAIRRDILPHVRAHRLEGDTLDVTLAASDATERRLEAWVALERACCSGLTWTVDRPRPDRLRLRVSGVSPDSALVALFAAGPGAGTDGPRPPSRLRRLAGALGAGTAFALAVCCAAPLAVAAIAGAAVAAPLAVLDDPVVIAVVAALVAIPAWIVLSRRKARAAGCGCGPAAGPGA